jgi:hypothetical protein
MIFPVSTCFLILINKLLFLFFTYHLNVPQGNNVKLHEFPLQLGFSECKRKFLVYDEQFQEGTHYNINISCLLII